MIDKNRDTPIVAGQSTRDDAQSLSLHYEAAEEILGTEIVSMVLFDRKTGKGDAWTRRTQFAAPMPVSYDSLVQRDLNYIADADKEKFSTDLGMERVAAAVESTGSYKATERYHFPKDSVRYLTYHFAPYSKNKELLFAVIEDSTKSHEQEGRSIADLYDNVPGGLVSYEWAGNTLTPIHVSKHYIRLFGEAGDLPLREGDVNQEKLHPDDTEGFQENVVNALAKNREAHHVYRVKNDKQGRYIWVRIDATAKASADGRTLVYAMYSNVSQMVDAERKLLKTNKSLESALETSNQIIWEYDPERHTATCYTKDAPFGMPHVIENYPDSLSDYPALLQEDAETFAACVREIDEGAQTSECRVRILIDGLPRWFSCKFFARIDPVTERRMATLFVIDINVRVAAEKTFQERIETLLHPSESSVIRTGIYNLSRNCIMGTNSKDELYSSGINDCDYDTMLARTSRYIASEHDRSRYLNIFSHKNLLALAQSGQRTVSMECLCQLEKDHTQWMEISAELMTNPINNAVEVIARMKDINKLHLSSLLINKSFESSYASSSVIFGKGAEYYLFDATMGANCEHRHNYWDDLQRVLSIMCSKDELERLTPLVAKETILPCLAKGKSPRIAFDGSLCKIHRRLEIAFSILDAENEIIFATIRDITDSALLDKLRYDSRHDDLTGLYNRKTTFARCEELLRQNPGETFVMLKLNVRRFRLFNAFFGEKAGDELLKEVGRQIQELLSDYMNCAYGRMESDIFCAFFPLDEASLKCKVKLVQQRFKNYRKDFLLEPSIGIYVVSDRSLPVEDMFARASSAAKEGGTRLSRCTWLYNDELERKLEAEVRIVSEMQAALDQEQFAVYLQPKFNLQTGEHVGAEALVRWIHPERGMILPGGFIPLFEGNGFITSLDHYMWEHVCILLRRWQDEGREVKPVSVNISRVSAYNPTTVKFLMNLVERYGIDPALLELEVTESAYVNDPDEISKSMRALQAAGFTILMDDFGSGYSSLNALRELPVDVLKLDIGFLSETCEDERSRTIIDSILAMTKRLGLPVIAEGVENERQADFLRSCGCEYVQGFLFARPMPVEDYESL